MQPRIQVITLAVRDLKWSFGFYHYGLGFPSEGILATWRGDGPAAFFDLDDGLILALYPKESLARDAKVPAGPSSSSEFSIGHSVESKVEVDDIMRRAKAAGATITEPAQDRGWGGYSGYFQDPDGHLWEIAWNPAREGQK